MIQGVLLDLDGTVYHGSEAVPGAIDFIERLGPRGVRHLFVTNRSSRSPRVVCDQLRGYGVPCEPHQVLTTAEATADWLGAGRTVYCIGEQGLTEALGAGGCRLTPGEMPDDVVVGLDTQLTYAKLATATRAIRAGARFIGTNPDKMINTEHGIAPGTGAALAALTAATGVEPIVIGKPEPILIDVALRRLGLPRETVVMIGDNLETDIAGGDRAGLRTAWILTGVSDARDLRAEDPQPTWIARDYPELEAQLFEPNRPPADR